MGITGNKGKAVSTETAKLARRERFLEKQSSQENFRKNNPNRLVCGIWGHPKTTKSGLALDFPNHRIFVLDWDNGVEPTWRQNHKMTDRITIFNPAEYDSEGNLMHVESDENSHDFVAYAKEIIDTTDEKVMFVFDGIDSWLECCNIYVTGHGGGRSTVPKFEWSKRTHPYLKLLRAVRELDCDQIYITHAKDIYGEGGFNVTGQQPNWIAGKKDLGTQLFQVIRTKRIQKGNKVIYKAELLSSKTNTPLVGKTWETLTVENGDVVWNGIPELREGTL